MTNFLFWNTGKNDVREVVTAAATELDQDFIILCELGVDGEAYRESIQQLGYRRLTGLIESRFCVLSRWSKELCRLREESNRYLIHEVAPPGAEPFLLMTLHAPSRRANWTETDLLVEFARYSLAVHAQQRQTGIEHAVMAGDFNANPWEPGLLSCAGFHALSEAAQVRQGSRIVQAVTYDYFYNPMWNLLGDQTPGPPGSHYYQGGTPVEPHWHLYDQVIVTSSLSGKLKAENVKLLTSIGKIKLATRRGRPRRQLSDHFPLYFQLEH